MWGSRRGPIGGSGTSRFGAVPPALLGGRFVNSAIGLWGLLGENADQVDDSVRSRDRTADAFVIQYIRFDDLRRFGRFSRRVTPGRVPHGHTHCRATLQKQRHARATAKLWGAPWTNGANVSATPMS